MPVDLPLRTRAAARVGTAVASVSRRLGWGSGSVIGGRAMLAIDRDVLARLAADRRLALVSGTNGKTTTTSLLCAALTTQGPVATNLLGANLTSGLAAALAEAPPDARTAALEVDEGFLGRVVEATRPAVAVVLNLSRDQLDRNNEVRRVAARWRAIWPSSSWTRVVANADDPLVVWAALTAAPVTWVGAGQPWIADAAGCPKCGGRIRFGGGGDGEGGWACLNCPLHRPDLDLRLEGDAVVTAAGQRIRLHLALPGRANRANAIMAAAAAQQFGVPLSRAVTAMADTAEVAGRYGIVTVGSQTRARMLLAKNPAGWLEVFDLVTPAPTPVVIAINARAADGKDPSWLWDVPFERLRGRLVAATGERSRDLAVRLHYAEVDHHHEPDPLLAVAATGASRVDVVANYTAFQAISALTRSRRG